MKAHWESMARILVRIMARSMEVAGFICSPEDSVSADCRLTPDWHPARSGVTCVLKWVVWFVLATGGALALGRLH